MHLNCIWYGYNVIINNKFITINVPLMPKSVLHVYFKCPSCLESTCTLLGLHKCYAYGRLCGLQHLHVCE